MAEVSENKSLAIANPTQNFEMNVQQLDKSELLDLKNYAPTIKVNAQYITIEDWAKEKVLKGFYMGLDIIPNEEGEAVEVVVIYGQLGKDENHAVFIAGQAILVSTLKKLPVTNKQLGVLTAVEIHHTGKKKARKGHVQTFDVHFCKPIKK